MSRLKMKPFGTVLRFEYMNYMNNKAYRAITVVLVVLIALALSLPAILSAIRDLRDADDAGVPDDPAETVHLVYESDPAADAVAGLEGLRLETAAPDDTDRLRDKVHEGTARALFIVHAPFDYTYIVRRTGMTEQDGARLQAAHDAYYRAGALAEHGLTQEEIAGLLSPSSLNQVETVEDSGKSMEQAYLYTYLLLMLLYMTVMMYGQMVATSVAGEKSNRAMEILITSARPIHLMFGKVIGSGLAGLTQIGVLIVTALVAYRVNEAHFADIPMVRSAFEASPVILIYMVVFYLLGYFMYAFLYGALGSLANRVEDINTTMTPIVLLLVVAMMLSILGLMSPEAGYVTVTSFIPFFAPMVMFLRIGMTDVPFWQVALSIAIMLGTTVGIGWLSARIYRIGVLMYGKPPRLSELIRTLRSERRASAK